MAPPSTPSPRRFVSAPHRQIKQSASKSRLPSQLRDEVPRLAEHDGTRSLRGDANEQFTSLPRFTVGRRPQSRSSPARHATAQAPAADEVQPQHDTSLNQNNSDDAPEQTKIASEIMLLGAGYDPPPAAQQTYDLPLSPKRRRVDHDIGVDAASTFFNDLTPRPAPRFSRGPPRSPAQVAPTIPKRFLPHTPASSSVNRGSTASPFLFRPPSASKDASVAPLPEAFSPHRRGARFVPGGMASSVQQWILETGQNAAATRRMQVGAAQEEFATKVQLSGFATSDSFPILLAGTDAVGEHVNVALIGTDSTNKGESLLGIETQSIIGLREPCWPFNDGTKQWIVCVDWKLLS